MCANWVQRNRGTERPSALSRGVVDWKSTLVSVVPAEAGIQAGFELELEKTNLDAGFRRNDELSLRLKARDFNHPEGDIKKTAAAMNPMHGFTLSL
jgi:hypothetical protein